MAETTPSQANVTAVANLEEALAHPEPMCLAMLEIHVPGATGQGSTAAAGSAEHEVMEQAYRRLRDTLRDYDELTRLDSRRFILVLRTLADASMLGGRMRSLYEVMTRPYHVSSTDVSDADVSNTDGSDTGTEIETEIFLGAAVRVPQETSAQLVDRVDQAVILARSSADGGPVML